MRVFFRPQAMSTSVLPLKNGAFVTLDSADIELVSGREWRLHYRRDGGPSGVASGKHPNIVLMHRVIAGAKAGEIVDHKDGDPLNNTRQNLRLCSHAQNMRNSRRHTNNRSGFKGVYLDTSKAGRRWRAEIRVDGTKYSLGSHATPEGAHSAYCRAAKVLHGEFARFA